MVYFLFVFMLHKENEWFQIRHNIVVCDIKIIIKILSKTWMWVESVYKTH